MAARARVRILRLLPGGQPRRRCANCQQLEQQVELLTAPLARMLAFLMGGSGSKPDVWETADRLGLRQRVAAELQRRGDA